MLHYILVHINLGFRFYFHLFFVNVLLKVQNETRRWVSLLCYVLFYRESLYSYWSTLVTSAASLVPENTLLPVINFPIYALSFFYILLDSIKSVVNYTCVTFITYCKSLFPTNFFNTIVFLFEFCSFILNAISVGLVFYYVS